VWLDKTQPNQTKLNRQDWNQIPKDVAIQISRDLFRFLLAESNDVHSNAASCIEKLLLVKDEGGRARYTAKTLLNFSLIKKT
jgi:exportin-2 (importin alpha re-exporter)